MQKNGIRKLLNHCMYTRYLLFEDLKQNDRGVDQTELRLYGRNREDLGISEIELLKKGFKMEEEEIFRQME